MFVKEPERLKNRKVLADYQGELDHGLVGIFLWESDGKIVELEAYSIDGSEVASWPDIKTLKPSMFSQR